MNSLSLKVALKSILSKLGFVEKYIKKQTSNFNTKIIINSSTKDKKVKIETQTKHKQIGSVILEFLKNYEVLSREQLVTLCEGKYSSWEIYTGLNFLLTTKQISANPESRGAGRRYTLLTPSKKRNANRFVPATAITPLIKEAAQDVFSIVLTSKNGIKQKELNTLNGLNTKYSKATIHRAVEYLIFKNTINKSKKTKGEEVTLTLR